MSCNPRKSFTHVGNSAEDAVKLRARSLTERFRVKLAASNRSVANRRQGMHVNI
jgi:hypothetical protein